MRATVAALAALMVLAPAFAAEPPLPPPEGRFCDEHPNKCEEMRARRAEFCAKNPQTCESADRRREERRRYCKQHPEECERLQDEREARRQKMKERCEADPKACEERKEQMHERREKRMERRSDAWCRKHPGQCAEPEKTPAPTREEPVRSGPPR